MTDEQSRDAARWLASQRKLHDHECVVCGRAFKGVAMARTCSATCRTTLYRRGKREAKKKPPQQ